MWPSGNSLIVNSATGDETCKPFDSESFDMHRSLKHTQESTRVSSLDSVRPKPAKADLAVNDSQSGLKPLIAEAIRRVTSQKAAAADMGIDPAQLTRQLQSGHLTVERLEALGPEYAAELGRLLVETFGPLSSPYARVKQDVREIRQLLDRIDQGVDFLGEKTA